MMPFLEAVFDMPSSPVAGTWHDRSDADYYCFESEFGCVRLRRRSAYPATFAAAYGSRLLFGYGDVGFGRSIAHQQLSQANEELFYDAEFLFAEADAANQTVRVQRDALSVLPVFASVQAKRLVLSNCFDRVCELMDRSALVVDGIALAEFLTSLPTYDRTLCSNVKLLYDRVRLLWSPKNRLLVPAPHARRSNKTGMPRSDVHFVRVLLEGTLDTYYRRYANGSPIACDLSGGMDSSLIVGYLRDRGHDPLTVSMLFPGAAGLSQGKKMQALQGRFALQNISKPLEVERHYPLDIVTTEGRPFYHYQLSAYFGVKQEMYGALAARRVPCVFNGYGGDELADNVPNLSVATEEDLAQAWQLRNDAAQPWLTPAFGAYFRTVAQKARTEPQRPIPLVAGSVAAGMAASHSAPFDTNVWPVSPLANPRLYQYCQGLPIRYRHNRNLIRMYLQARRFPECIYNGTKELFSEHYTKSTLQHLEQPLRHYLERSVLAAHGLIDTKILLDTFMAAKHSGRYTSTLDDFAFKAVTVLAAEINLQALGLQL